MGNRSITGGKNMKKLETKGEEPETEASFVS